MVGAWPSGEVDTRVPMTPWTLSKEVVPERLIVPSPPSTTAP